MSNKLEVGDLVLVCDPDSGVFEPRYNPNYRIFTIHGANRLEVQDEKGHKSLRQTGHIKKIEPVDKVCHQLPPNEVYKQYGLVSKLLIHPRDVPDIDCYKLHKVINRTEEVLEVECETIQVIQSECDECESSKKSIYREKIQEAEGESSNKKNQNDAQISEKSKRSLNRLGIGIKEEMKLDSETAYVTQNEGDGEDSSEKIMY